MQEYVIKTAAGETTVLLSDEDAKSRGLSVAEHAAATAPANKARTPRNKQA